MQNNWFINIARVLLFVGILGIACFPRRAVFAAPPTDDFVVNPEAEQYVQEQLLAGNPADLAVVFPDEAQRVIGSEFLSQLIVSSGLQDKSQIFIANAVILGDITGEAVNVPFDISFSQCHFMGGLNFNRTRAQNIAIENSVIEGPIFMNTAIVNGRFSLANSTTKDTIDFISTSVVNDADFTKVIFEKVAQFYNFSAENLYFEGAIFKDVTVFVAMNIETSTSFRSTTFEKPATFSYFSTHYMDFSDATFEDETALTDISVATNAYFDNTTFKKSTTFEDSSVEKTASFTGATFTDTASFKNVSVGRKADFSKAVFEGQADFSYLNAPQLVNFIDTTFNQGLSFDSASVGAPYFKNTLFNGPTSFDGMQVSGNFEITNSNYSYTKEPLSVYLVNVAGNTWFDQITAPAGIKADHSHFGSLEFNTKYQSKIATIDLTETKIDTNLTIKNLELESLSAQRLSVGESTYIENVHITKSIDLNNAEVGFLLANELTWPKSPSAFNLRGMSFTDIDLGQKGLTLETWGELLDIVDTSEYSPQTYQQISQFLTDKGHPDWAAEVQLAGKRRERDEVLAPFSAPWLWSWFLDIFSGYGHRPILAFLWSALVITIGALMYRRQEDMLPVDQDTIKAQYNPVWYSFALFLPYIDLGIASKWEPNPERKWARNYKYIHMMLGWVLMPIALLTFGGILG